jgi:hypothetical protein
MRVGDVYGGNYLKSEDLDGDLVVTIDSVRIKKFEDGDKVMIRFNEIDKTFVANATNCNLIAELLGDEMDDWDGQKITLFVDKNVMFKGKRVPALRVRTKPVKPPGLKREAVGAGKSDKPEKLPPLRQPGDDDGDDEAPY